MSFSNFGDMAIPELQSDFMNVSCAYGTFIVCRRKGTAALSYSFFFERIIEFSNGDIILQFFYII